MRKMDFAETEGKDASQQFVRDLRFGSFRVTFLSIKKAHNYLNEFHDISSYYYFK